VLRRSGIGFPDGSNETCGKVGFAASHGQRRFRSTCLTIHSSGQTNRCAFGLPLSSGVSVLMNMTRKIMTLTCVAFAGALLAFATIPSVGWAAAIATPAGFLEWFRAAGTLELAVLLWSFAVDGLLGIGLAFLVVALVALRFSDNSRVTTLVFLLFGFLLGSYFLVPHYFGDSSFIATALLGRRWWGYGVELALVVSALAAAFLHSQISRYRALR